MVCSAIAVWVLWGSVLMMRWLSLALSWERRCLRKLLGWLIGGSLEMVWSGLRRGLKSGRRRRAMLRLMRKMRGHYSGDIGG